MPKKSAVQEELLKHGKTSAEFSRKTEQQILHYLSSRKQQQDEHASLEQVSIKKLGKVWDDLTGLGFTHEDVKEVLTRIREVSLPDALDWLCLNVDEDKLPVKFRSTYRPQDEFKGGIEIIAPSIVESAPVASEAPSPRPEPPKPAIQGVELMKKKEQEEKAAAAAEAAAHRAWILQKYDNVDDSEEGSGSEEDEDEDEGEDEDLPNLVNSLEARLEAFKHQAKRGKEMKNVTTLGKCIETGDALAGELESCHKKLTSLASGMYFGKKTVSRNSKEGRAIEMQGRKDLVRNSRMISQCKGELESLKKVLKASSGAGNEKKEEESPVSREFEAADMFSMDALFDEPAPSAKCSAQAGGNLTSAETKKPEGGEVKEGEEVEATILDVNEALKGWTGKTPKVMLIEFCAKNKLPKPKFAQMRNNPARCKVLMGEQVHEGPAQFVCAKVMEAEHVAACYALYKISQGRQLYRMMPALFRDLWLGWEKGEDEEKAKGEKEKEEARETVLEELLRARSLSRPQGPATSGPTAAQQADKSSSVTESWDADEQERKQEGNKTVSHGDGKQVSEELFNRWKTMRSSPEWQRLWEGRKLLPIYSKQEEMLSAIRSNTVTIIVGETGCGKSTQVPQMILDEFLSQRRGEGCRIICTQPRRVAAIGVAERVAAERGETPGAGGALCAHQIRMESTRTEDTRILFCTTGILLRRLQDDPQLEGISHVIVDEAHERDVLCDFLLVILRGMVERRPDMRLVIMSATMDADRFSRYFFDAPVFTVPGRTFPVEDLFLEDVLELTGHRIVEGHPCAIVNRAAVRGMAKMTISTRGGNSAQVMEQWDEDELDGLGPTNDAYEEALYTNFSESTRLSLRRVDEEKINYDLICDVLLLLRKSLDDEKASPGVDSWEDLDEEGMKSQESVKGVLIFLPGIGEIMQLYDQLMASSVFSDRKKFVVHAAHSSLPPEEQRRIFVKPPPHVQKIVIATNIAETSITIDDIAYVIDTGRVKETRYNERAKMRLLVETWIDRASMRQRAGRAGRVQAGKCFHLYTRVRSASYFDEHKTPEMRRVPLEELCLQILSMGHRDVASFLGSALDPPSETAVKVAMQTLSDVQAVDEEGGLTALGQHLSRLPVDPHIGKLLIMGCIFSCLNPILTIAACCSYKMPFLTSIERRGLVDDARKKLAGQHPVSDLLVASAAYDMWVEASRGEKGKQQQVCRQYSMSQATLIQIRDLRSQFKDLLRSIGFINKVGDVDEDKASNANSRSKPILCSIIFAGLYPNLVQVEQSNRDILLRGPDGSKGLVLHRSSVMNGQGQACARGALVTYHQKMATSRPYVMDATIVHGNAALLFGGKLVLDHIQGVVSLDGWLQLKVPARTAVIVKELRKELERVLTVKVRHPRMDLSKESSSLVQAVVLLLKDAVASSSS